MRSISQDDARIVRASIVNDQRGGRTFDAGALAKRWDEMSERGKSALLPESGLRTIMDDAADRAAASARDPLANVGPEGAFLAFERMASNRGDSIKFRTAMTAMSPEEANAARALIIHRMGLAAEGTQNAEGNAFSISRFLTRWNAMTPQAKLSLFGDGEMRENMTDLARLAERVKASERLAGHSNTGAINNADATTKGLGFAAVALLTGHPLVGATIAAPIAFQRVSAKVLTSKRLLNWIGRAPKKPNIAAQRAHIRRLGSIAHAEPAIAVDIFQLQTRLASAYNTSLPTKIAAEESFDHRPEPENEREADNPSN